ncbi:MAG: GntR family transcriptional regulator [Acidiferrobacteraceae bacterium]|nr:GntR family transcriptional regulator [Acidiferrobacteraceae bacterium]HJP05946.1 GntR family transcriptional regulator [Arenicellales bacterium]
MEKRPLYEQVKETLLARLAGDYWRPGALLPSEPKLAGEFGVSQGTIRRALDDLVSQGLLARYQGRGTAVTEHTPFGFFHLFREDGTRELPESKTLRISVNPPSRAERDALELASGKKVIRIQRVRYLNLEPKIFETICISHDLFSGLAKMATRDLPNTVYNYYEQKFGVPIVGKRERLRAAAATQDEARYLHIEIGAPLLEIECIAYSHRSQPIEWRISRCLTDEHYYCNPPE